MVEEYRLDAAMAAADADPEAAAEVVAITPLPQIKIRVYAVHLDKISSIMIRKGKKTRCGRLGRILSTI